MKTEPVYFCDYDHKSSKHSLKRRSAMINENGIAIIQFSEKEIIRRQPGEWINETMMKHNLKACIHETLKQEVKKEMEDER